MLGDAGDVVHIASPLFYMTRFRPFLAILGGFPVNLGDF
jgi:hypothetical protein